MDGRSGPFFGLPPAHLSSEPSLIPEKQMLKKTPVTWWDPVDITQQSHNCHSPSLECQPRRI